MTIRDCPKMHGQLHYIAYYVKKGKLLLSQVLEDGLLGRFMVISPKK